jgi:hypothetical protein
MGYRYTSGFFKPAALHLIVPPSPLYVNPLACAKRFYEEHKKQIEQIEGFPVQSAHQCSDWCIDGWGVS